MERLKFIDQFVHKITTTGLPPLNMQGALIVDPAKGRFPVTPEALGEHLAARLGKFPVLRKKLVQDPLRLGDIRLVDDPRFDVHDHISCARLPSPGGEKELLRHLGHFSAQPLDLSRPLWRLEIISGLAGGRIAFVQKLSHATMDGILAMKMMQSIFDAEPQPPEKPGRGSWQPDREPTRLGLLVGALRETGSRAFLQLPSLLRSHTVPAARQAARAVAGRLKRGVRANEASSTPLVMPRRTSLNVMVSIDKRLVAYRSFELDPLRSIARRLDCSVNDLGLLLASEAVQSYFSGVGERIDFDLFATVPLNTRAAGDSRTGNVLTMVAVNLHSTNPDLVERLRAIHRQTVEAKNVRDASLALADAAGVLNPDQVLALLSPLLLDALGIVLRRAAPWKLLPLMANTIVSNVPGPRETPYLAGMPVEEQIPIIPVFHTSALATGITTTGNRITFGFHGCGTVLDERAMRFLVDGLVRAHARLLALAAPRAQATKDKPRTKAPARVRAPAPRGSRTAKRSSRQDKRRKRVQ